ncbi:uncharacterized protein [Embiotoca jacksoni]|uniref:uncharacterized protein n=1 Tax=Embiotoca jacksoni TaxID=100190 RepID=UPI0037045C75
MKMKKMRSLLFVTMVTVFMSALFVVASIEQTTEPTAADEAAWTPTGRHGVDLSGKMFTLSRYGGQVTFYDPNAFPAFSTTNPTSEYLYRTTTTPYRTTTTPYRTTAPPTRGVSVCLRYITDFLETSSPTIFTLSPSKTPLSLQVSYLSSYTLTFNNYNSLRLKPNIRMWSYPGQDIWTSVCLTVDTRKQVAQVFSGSNMSIRKLMPYRYVWAGEHVMTFPGFDGQVTDVQVWDYPLRYKEVQRFLYRGYFRNSGSVLTWSNINYSLGRLGLLEDTYELQGKQLIGQKARGRDLKEDEKPGKLFMNEVVMINEEGKADLM